MSFTDAELLAELDDMRGYATYLTKSRELSKDLVQDTVEKVLRCRGYFTPDGRPDALHRWWITIMANMFTDEKRKLTRQRDAIFPDLPQSSPASQEKVIELKETIKVWRRLKPRSRRVLLLTELTPMSIGEIGKHMNLPSGTIKSAASRGRARLARLTREGDAG